MIIGQQRDHRPDHIRKYSIDMLLGDRLDQVIPSLGKPALANWLERRVGHGTASNWWDDIMFRRNIEPDFSGVLAHCDDCATHCRNQRHSLAKD